MVTPEKNRRLFLLLALLAVSVSLFAAYRYARPLFYPAATSRDVVLYTTSWCGYCARLRRDLSASNVPYKEYDVEHSLRGWFGFQALHGRGVPVSTVGPKIIHGYNVKGFTEALHDIGYTYTPASDAQGS